MWGKKQLIHTQNDTKGDGIPETFLAFILEYAWIELEQKITWHIIPQWLLKDEGEYL